VSFDANPPRAPKKPRLPKTDPTYRPQNPNQTDLDNLCYYFQSRSWHRTLALASVEARSTAETLNRGLSTLASYTDSLASGLDVASRSERVRAATLRFGLWLCAVAAARGCGAPRALPLRLAALSTLAFLVECALVSFHGGRGGRGAAATGRGPLAWLPLPPLLAALLRTLSPAERESAVSATRVLHAWGAALLAAAGAVGGRAGAAALGLVLPPRLRAQLLRSEAEEEKEGEGEAWEPSSPSAPPAPRNLGLREKRAGARRWCAWWRGGGGTLRGESAASFALLLQLKAAASKAELRLAAQSPHSGSGGSGSEGSSSEGSSNE
jgi:hypothetical protein